MNEYLTIEGGVLVKCSMDASGSIIIPESVTSIGDRAFYGCPSLKSIVIPDGVTSIGDKAFYYCESLKSIVIPASVTSIGEDAFCHCSSFLSIVIPDGVTSIGDGAFMSCESLESIVIPDSVTSIGEFAFLLSSLKSITVSPYNPVYDSRANCNGIIETATNKLLVGCRSTVIPDGVTSIGDEAFRGRTSLKSIVIPDSVTSIGDRAFWGCSSLESIIVSPGNAVYDSRDNCNAIIETSTNRLIAKCRSAVLPDGITRKSSKVIEISHKSTL